MVTTYNARVKYPADDEPFKGPYGESYNVAVEILDANGNHNRDAPSAKPNTGLVNVYKRVDQAQEVAYLKSLASGDMITLQHRSQKGKDYYDFVIEPGWNPPAPQQQSNTTYVETVSAYTPYSESDLANLKHKMEQEAELTVHAALELDRLIKQTDLPISPDTMLRTGSGLRISAERDYKKGSVFTEDHVDVSQEDVNAGKLNILKSRLDGTIETAIAQIVALAPVAYSVEAFRADGKAVGVEKEHFATNDSVVEIADAIWQMLELIEGGMDKAAAISATREIWKEQGEIAW
jgi:hypothetical protein